MTDHEIVLAIQAVLTAAEWSADTPCEVADILEANGYVVPDLTDCDDYEDGE